MCNFSEAEILRNGENSAKSSKKKTSHMRRDTAKNKVVRKEWVIVKGIVNVSYSLG